MSAEMVKAYFDRHGDDYGVGAICRALQMAPSSYWRPPASQRTAHCALRGARLWRDEGLNGAIKCWWLTNWQVYRAIRSGCR